MWAGVEAEGFYPKIWGYILSESHLHKFNGTIRIIDLGYHDASKTL